MTLARCPTRGPGGTSAPYGGGTPGPELPWQMRFAEVLRKECGLTGPALARNLRWVKMARERGQKAGVSEDDLLAAIRGLRHVMRIEKPWNPYAVFKRANRGLFNSALSAGRRIEERGPQPIGAVLKQLAREAGT